MVNGCKFCLSEDHLCSNNFTVVYATGTVKGMLRAWVYDIGVGCV